ncbi:MAG: EAL domain-containing protein [Leptolyngbya sp. DLM2.Bin15]|nr:MAG: EAL domain-containing protein [Leptolyngbya sp. DLM2.Bin15]
MHHDRSRFSLFTSVVLYAIASSAWLLGSDRLFAWMLHQPVHHGFVQLLTDLSWIGFSCLYIVWLVRRDRHRPIPIQLVVAAPTQDDPSLGESTPDVHPVSQATSQDAKLYADLQQAIQRQEFRLCYQPIVLLTNEDLVGFEALIRWRHPIDGERSPVQFMPLVETTDLTAVVDAWVLEEACRQMKWWQQHYPIARSLVVSVNLSGQQFCQPNLVTWVKSILDSTGLPAKSLKLEVTETTLMKDAQLAVELLEQLNQIGVKLSIDDFGTGYSSLSYLYRFPMDTLKIDRSFLNHIDVDGEQVELVRTILMLAWNLGLDTIAEGIETPMQLAQLKSLRCTYGQGFLFSEPLEASEMGKFLKKCQQANHL